MIPEVTAAGKSLALALEVVRGELSRVKLKAPERHALEEAACWLAHSLALTRAAYAETKQYVTLADRAALDVVERKAKNGQP